MDSFCFLLLIKVPSAPECVDWKHSFLEENQIWQFIPSQNHLLARLQGTQVALARKISAYLYSLESQLTQEYNSVLHKEYLYWRLKSRIKWLNYGDANNKYFHIKTIQRRSYSWVITLKDDTGLWLIGEPLTQHIHSAFKNLFQAKYPSRCPTSRTELLCSLNSPFPTQAQVLTRIPQLDEILQTLRELPPLKALGLDGYHAFFF